jgi:Domain of unknown function (DUF5666)/Carboxypeptidase regulatory-like domain
MRSSAWTRIGLPLSGLLATLLTFSFCSDSDRSPTSPGPAVLSGTVIRGSSTLGQHALGMEMGLAGVTVSVMGTAKSTQTDGSGNFTLTGLPAGSVELGFERADIHARGRVSVMAGTTTTVTIAIVGSSAVVAPAGHAGEEIEGLVSSIDSDVLTVLDQRLGAVVVHADGSTLIRSGASAIALTQIQVGNRVHVKALKQEDQSYLATEILLQSDKVGGNRQVSGSVSSVDSGTGSFVVQSGVGTVKVETNSATTFRRRGSSATLADVTVGSSVDVNGILQSNGSVLARKVTLEG